MEAFTYEALAGRVVFGVGARREVAAEVADLGATRVVIVAGGHEKVPADEIAASLGEAVVGRFDDVAQHVPVARVRVLRELVSDTGAEVVVTIGGGSATGFGKAVALDPGVPQIAVPTTYAGSEMTPIWGMTDGDHKRTGRDPAVVPRVVVYDPELTTSLPAAIAGPSGLNAVAHCVEALYGPGRNPVTELVALEGIRVLAAALPAMVDRPDDLDARSDALYGAYLAGCALAVAGTALHHRTCHVLGGMFALNHGDMNAVILPHALAYTRPAIPRAYSAVSETLGADAAVGLYELGRRLGAPSSLADIGMPREGIVPAAGRIVEEAAANPQPPETAGVVAMLQRAFDGAAPEPVR